MPSNSLSEKETISSVLGDDVIAIDMGPKTNIFLLKCHWEEVDKTTRTEVKIESPSAIVDEISSNNKVYHTIETQKRGKYILVDTGKTGDHFKLIQKLEETLHITPNDLSLIVITHAHFDHSGSCWYLQKHYPHVPIAVPYLEADLFRKAISAPSKPTNLLARFTKKVLGDRLGCVPFEPDLLFKGGERLDDYGVKGRVVQMKGHTDGGLVVLLDNKKAAIVNDLMAGSLFSYGHPKFHNFIEDPIAILTNMKSIYDEGHQVIMVTHGYAFTREPFGEWLNKELGILNK
ncbi:hypothetical protein C9374_004203 [Naegleria lovaniensis]|uniref:Metallo-beta-lactamase domain-containing protein n=1 Tax=Naegleria lovaniensis TaxID=51637 RepID=A0AA88GS21_NAELO|nr:uncharacterized protein C9374_004203 [Naegleria lovaniensis]KAG2383532.1 hypothetical protein C9374_004203 [Naegleria lovaniensis]